MLHLRENGQIIKKNILVCQGLTWKTDFVDMSYSGFFKSIHLGRVESAIFLHALYYGFIFLMWKYVLIV